MTTVEPQVPLNLTRSAPPQFHERSSTGSIMWSISAALLPAAAWGVYAFGLRALVVMATAVVVSTVTEVLIARLVGRSTLADGSAALTGLLIGMMMPPTVPLFVVGVAAVFAIGVVKWTYGGLEGHWMNPALAARVFVSLSWPGAMAHSTWPSTLATDGLAVPDVLTAVRTAAREGEVVLTGMTTYLARIGYPRSALDVTVTEWINSRLLGSVGTVLPGGYVDLFTGNTAGAIGEVSIALLLLGTVFLFGRQILTWEVPGSYFLVFASLTWVFGGLAYGVGHFSGDVLFQLLSGALILTMFYIATDMTTTPMTSAGLLVFGAGAGALTFLLRSYGGAAEGAAAAVLVMNVLTPAINRITRPRRYGRSWRVR